MGKRVKMHEEKMIKKRTGFFLEVKVQIHNQQCRHLSARLTTVRRYLLDIQNAGHTCCSLYSDMKILNSLFKP